MDTTRLGKTGLTVSRTAFGALPIQRATMEDAIKILRKAFDSGITFFDTARGYTDSEEKLGRALADVRGQVVLATKTSARDAATLFLHLETSLKNLKTDHVDILQLHNPEALPRPDGPGSLYQALLDAKEKGMVRFVGISSHRLPVAVEAVNSGLFDTLQFPLSYISSPEDLNLVELCEAKDVGLLAMKALCGGLVTNIEAAFAFLRQYGNVVPLWGIQRESELDQFVALEAHPPALDSALLAAIERDRKELSGTFCRACGYCLPCPAGIPIPLASRMKFLLRRAPYQSFVTEHWQNEMAKIKKCTGCRECASRCPYNLDPPTILKAMLADYEEFCAAHKV